MSNFLISNCKFFDVVILFINSFEKEHQILYHHFSHMEIGSSFSSAQMPTLDSHDGMIALYRRHIARAIQEERWVSAEIFTDRILDAFPDNTEALLVKAWIKHYCRRDEDQAVRYYQKVIDIAGDDRDHPHAIRARRSMDRILAAAS